MTVAAIDWIEDLEKCGVTLSVEGKDLRWEAPGGMMSPDLLAEMKQRKVEVIAALWERTPPAQNDPDFWGKLTTILIHHAPAYERPRLTTMFRTTAANHVAMGLEPDVCQQMGWNRVAEEVERVTGVRMALTFPEQGKPVGVEVFAIYEGAKPHSPQPVPTVKEEHQEVQGALYATVGPE